MRFTKNIFNSKIQTKITVTGIGYFILSLIVLLMGINYSNNLIYALAYFLFAFMFLSFWQTRQQLVGIKFGTWYSSPIFAGQTAKWKLQASKKSALPSWGLLAYNNEYKGYYPIHLSQGESKTLVYKMQSTIRGVLQPREIKVCSTYPFGLFRACIKTDTPNECIVYPKPYGELKLPVDNTSQDAHLQNESETLASLRKYELGDSLRRVSWKSFAKTDQLMTKQFDGAKGDPALWFNMSDLSLETEQCLSQICRWIVDAQNKGLEYGLRLNNKELKPDCSIAHCNNCLKTLALYNH